MAGYTAKEKLFETNWTSKVKANQAFALLYSDIIKPMEERIEALEEATPVKAKEKKPAKKKSWSY